MPSFDIVSKADMPSVNNAINGVIREISTRYDFKGSQSSVEIKEQIIIILQLLSILSDFSCLFSIY